MKKILLVSFAMMLLVLSANAQDFVWGSTDVRYMQDEVPQACQAPVLSAWRGERVNLQAVFRAAGSEAVLSVSASDLKCGKKIIPSTAVSGGCVDYVIADYFGKIGQEISLQPDRIVNGDFTVKAGKTCPVWYSIQIPQDAAPGKYKGNVSVESNGEAYSLPFTINVIDRVLPAPDKWSFHLDLWQNPYAVARWFNVPLWSEEHFNKMRPIAEKYAAAGGKVITTSIIQHPWNSQTYDPFESMIAKIKGLDGKWSYDYTVFDKWVEFMLSCGVTEQIDCYTIVPWGYTFEYFDLATSTVKNIDCKPGEQAYEDYILPLLTDFAKHLKEKGWFDKTCIAMDERPTDQLVAARKVLKKADPEFKIEGAVNYSPKVIEIMYDISVFIQHSDFPSDVIAQRTKDNLRTTIYTCCGPAHPNTFTFSPLAEQEYLGIFSAANGYNGYLRWALCSWPENPVKDSRFGGWVSGDTYLLYPEGSSIRFERLIEGIQDFEKIRILKENADPKTLAKIEEILAPFKEIILDETLDACGKVNAFKTAINKF